MTAYRAVQERVQQAVAALRPQLTATPQVALILGSGLGELAGRIGTGFSVPYADIPHFKASGAPSHAGRLVFGTLCGTQVVAMQGRVHGYEGNTPEEVVFPLQVMHALGARTLIVTNASGGINTAYSVGDLMLIADHINFTGTHPLTFGPGSKTEAKTEAKAEAKTGVKAGHSPRSAQDAGIGSAGAFGLAQVFTSTFPDMTFAYTPHLRALARQAAHNSGITLREGVYLGLRGPSFETPAEIRAFRMWGADAVGMSTVHEVIVARALGMDVLGLSLITNMAAGILEQPITSQEVYDTARQSAHKMGTLVEAILPQLPQLKQ